MARKINDIKNIISNFISQELSVELDEIDPDMNLGAYGLGSVAATTLTGILEDEYDLTLSPLLVFDYPTIDTLATAIDEQLNATN